MDTIGQQRLPDRPRALRESFASDSEGRVDRWPMAQGMGLAAGSAMNDATRLVMRVRDKEAPNHHIV